MKTLREVAWYGKLPERGDFVGRGLPPRWRADWDEWLQRGLALAATTLGEGELRERLGGFTPWRYVALPASGETWCGIMVPSRDRVGRAFPLTLVERISAATSPAESAARLAKLLPAAAEGPEALEQAIAALPPGSLRESAPAASARQPCSFWWPLAAASASDPLVASWPPAPSLLPELLGRYPASHQTAMAE
jgi:type VI secretion system protein ImpM